jgi:hypothetical protein
MPNFGDRGKLPFVSALLAETLRWKVVTPLGEAMQLVSSTSGL